MTDHLGGRVRQVEVTDPVGIAARPFDYADAFEVVLSEPAPTLLRCGLVRDWSRLLRW
jgi:hypothetical protein